MNTTDRAGHCWVFGDNIDTDALAPGQYIKASIETLAEHCLETVDADFARAVRPGDIVVAGKNFGTGSSREQAVQALQCLGVGGVVALSYGGIFFRNAINLGLPVLQPVERGKALDVLQGQSVELLPEQALLINHSKGQRIALQALPDFLLEMLQAGGLVKVLEKRFNVAH